MDTTFGRIAGVLCAALSFCACTAESSSDGVGAAGSGSVEVAVAVEALCFGSGTRCEGNGVCRSNQCCHPSCTGKCGGESDGCGRTCPNPCSSGTCSKWKCSVCPACTFGCGQSTPECWNCSRTIRSGSGTSSVSVFQCDSDGSDWRIVDYCGVSDCSSAVETATCFGSSGVAHCSWTGGTLPNGMCPP